jgi:hypothetical protein
LKLCRAPHPETGELEKIAAYAGADARRLRALLAP